jgi:hypothetical protein
VRSGHVVTEHFKAIAQAMVQAQNQVGHPVVIVPARTNMMDADALDQYAAQILAEVFGLTEDGQA